MKRILVFVLYFFGHGFFLLMALNQLTLVGIQFSSQHTFTAMEVLDFKVKVVYYCLHGLAAFYLGGLLEKSAKKSEMMLENQKRGNL